MLRAFDLPRDSYKRHLKILVYRRWNDQAGRCYYCLRPMWVHCFHTSEYAVTVLGVPRGQLNELRGTAEHLLRRVDGGRANARNIVAACFKCNCDRGERDVLQHVKAMRQKYKIRDEA